jgi:hypothetical protein
MNLGWGLDWFYVISAAGWGGSMIVVLILLIFLVFLVFLIFRGLALATDACSHLNKIYLTIINH